MNTRIIGMLLAAAAACPGAEPGEPVLVGAAKVDVTPAGPVLLAGYGSRSREFDGIDTRLWARALVIGDADPVAIVVLDNCGVPAKITARLAERLDTHGIAPGRLVVAATHTHNAPNLEGYAPVLWAGRTTPEQDRHIAAYTGFAVDKMESAVVAALNARRPMRLEWAQGRVAFGGNRRVLRDGKWGGFGFQRNGPVDHSLPVLAARDQNGVVRAVWANYACHCTTVGSRNHVGGDWAGFANESMEKEFPTAVALMTIGCGADVGPQPTGNLDLAGKHGRSIGVEVARLLGGETTPLPGPPVVAGRRIALPLQDPKPRAHWEQQVQRGGFHGQLGKAMLAKLDAGGKVPAEVDYPVTAWKFGEALAMVFLPGEVVVDYSVRLNRELDWSRLWLTAWSNAMPGYIPSKRVLAEGGYEPDFSQVYYEQPGRYKPEVEEVLVGAVRDLAGDRFAAKPGQEPAPFHRLPGGESLAFQRIAAWAKAEKPGEENGVLELVRRRARIAVAAIGEIIRKDGEDSEWHNYAGDFARRVFIRQDKAGAELAWRSPPVEKAGSVVFCFTGGMGWTSQPKTEGFGLFVGGRRQLTFDVTRAPSRWISEDEKVELVYLPAWTSNEDSGGFFFVSLPEPPAGPLSVRSLGEGSKRWFAIDSTQEIPRLLKKLSAAIDR